MAQYQDISAVLTPCSAVPVMLVLPAVKLLRFPVRLLEPRRTGWPVMFW